LSDEEFLDDQKNWFDLKNKSINVFFWKCEKWMKEVMKGCEQAEEIRKRKGRSRLACRKKDAGKLSCKQKKSARGRV